MTHSNLTEALIVLGSLFLILIGGIVAISGSGWADLQEEKNRGVIGPGPTVVFISGVMMVIFGVLALANF